MSVDSLKTMMGIVFQNLQAVQSNLANVDTPGYKRQEVDFQTVFMELQIMENYFNRVVIM